MKQDQEFEGIDWKNRYQELINSLNIGFVVCDMKFGIIDFNDKYVEMTGYKPSQLQGRHMGSLYNKVELEKLTTTVLRHRVKDQYQYESTLFTADGTYIPILTSSHVSRNSKGEAQFVNVLVTDIRDLKNAQKELELANQTLLRNQIALKQEKGMLETILFGIGDQVNIFDRQGRHILGKPQANSGRDQKQQPLLPLQPGLKQELTLEVKGQQRRFEGKMEAIRYESGEIYAYAEILKDVTPLIKLRQRERELNHIRREVARDQLGSRMIGSSPAIEKVFDLIIRCTEVEFDVVVYGETGVGKGLAVQEIHARSPRKDKPFIAVNCGALPESLLESELFGHVKGAFTGAISNRPGLFREAEGGVIFLDEIGDISKVFQAKLLRVFEEREVRPIGSSKSHKIDVRIITATNRDLKQMTDEGSFRLDLFYRLSVIPVHIPALRERKEDILPLANHFITLYGKRATPKKLSISQSVQQLLLDYAWPGNIRELQNAIKHAVAIARGSTITVEDLPVQISHGGGVAAEQSAEAQVPGAHPNHAGEGSEALASDDSFSILSRRVVESNKNLILAALRRNQGNSTRTARDLGMSRTTLWRKKKMYGIN
jgi:PAS domain S-box-containing protein